ncbi:MAG: M56 family metallopeptidase [Clostridium sp.]|nr:M56 family metallopeptidase [Clostridium sp.]
MANLIYSSLVFSLFAGILLLLRKNMNLRYSSKFFYGIWIILLLRLLIPMNIFENIAPIRVNFDQVQERLFQINKIINPTDLNDNIVVSGDDVVDNLMEVPVVKNPLEQNSSYGLGEILEKSLNWNNIILAAWLSGVIISLGLVLFSYLKFKKRMMKKITPINSKHREAIEGLVDKRIQVFISEELSSPMVMGLIKPKLVLVESLFFITESSVDLKEGAKDVIHHELVHLQRKDILVKYLYLLARSIHWFNPLVYKVGPTINEDIELSCDEYLAHRMSAAEKKNYCSLILSLAGDTSGPPNLYTTNFNGGAFFMKKRFKNIINSGQKKRGISLSLLLTIIILGSAIFVSCSGQGENNNEILEVPSYHLFPYRSEPFTLFYESDERIGFQILEGIFIYNYKSDKLEAEFSLNEEAFGENFYLAPAMGEDEETIIISGFNPSDGTPSEYYYKYDISNENLKKINEDPENVKMISYPSTERQDKALKASSWELLDLRYYPEGSEVGYTPFKKDGLPLKEYVMKTEENTTIAPMLTLTDNGEFQFTYNIAMSYLNFGQYTIDGDTFTLVTENDDRTFVFRKEGNTLIFNGKESFDCILANGKQLKDGAVFE